MSQDIPSYEDTQVLHEKFMNAAYQHWLHHDLFSFNWWLLLAVTIGFYLVWLKTLDKARLTETILFGSLVTVMALVMDIFGVDLLWWGYPDNLIPIEPAFLILDLSQVPIALSAVYQRYGDSTKQLFFGLTGLAALYAYGVEPLLVWLGIYRLHHWKYTYSFLLYILIGFAARQAVHFIKKVEKRERKEMH